MREEDRAKLDSIAAEDVGDFLGARSRVTRKVLSFYVRCREDFRTQLEPEVKHGWVTIRSRQSATMVAKRASASTTHSVRSRIAQGRNAFGQADV